MSPLRSFNDAEFPTMQDHATKRMSQAVQATFSIVPLLAGLLISFLVVRCIDPTAPKGIGLRLFTVLAMTPTGVRAA